jgi:hypothetical protein
MRESTRRKFDWLYEGKRRRALRRIYSGDPSDSTNTRRILHEEIFGRSASGNSTEGTPGVWIPQFWYHQVRTWLRNQRKKGSQ